jgi:hypothetical protein
VLFCPECRGEFEDWVEVCPDCKVALVKELPPLPERERHQYRQEEPLVRIAVAPNEIIANMWSGILKEHGVSCLLKGNTLKTVMYSLPFDQPCEIYALSSVAERAREILAPFIDVNA